MLFGRVFQQVGGVVSAEGRESLGVGVDRDAGGGQRGAKLRQVGEPVAVDDEAVEGVADADAPGFGVADYGAAFCEVAVAVEVGVDDAGAGFDDRNAGVFAHEADQARAAARNDDVDVTHGVQQRSDGGVVRRKQGEGVFVDAFAAQGFVQQGGDGFVGVTGVAAALQHAGVARFDAEREDVGRDVGPRFADHADHAERNPPFDDGHSVGAGAPLQLFALRRGQVRDGFHVVGDGGDALRSQPQTVAQRRVGGHGFEVAGVGFEQAGRMRAQQLCGVHQRASESFGFGLGQKRSGLTGGFEQGFVFHSRLIRGRGNRSGRGVSALCARCCGVRFRCRTRCGPRPAAFRRARGCAPNRRVRNRPRRP